MLKETEDLRGKAWSALKATQAFPLFKALDDAVVAAGGSSMLATAKPVAAPTSRYVFAVHHSASRRVSQGDAADMALRENGEPMHIASFMEAAKAKGAVMRGDDPLANFRAAVSKDPRFTSLRTDDGYFWWFTDQPLPTHWKAEGGLDFAEEVPPSASSSTNQEGGDGHGPATT